MERILIDLLRQAVGTAALIAMGWAGYRVARRLKWPAAAMLGALLFLGVLNISGVKFPFYKAQLSFFSKVMSGVILGQKISRDMMSLLKKMALPAAFSATWMVLGSIMTGLLVFTASGGRLSLMTSLAASSAGGIAEMSVFAMSVGADVGVVAFFQSMRIIVLYVMLPFSTSIIARRAKKTSLPAGDERHDDATFSPAEILRFALLTCVAALLVDKAGMPSGLMIGAMAGAGAQNVWTGKVMRLSPWLKNGAQICLSATITAGLSPQTVTLLIRLFVPLMISLCVIQAMSFLLAFIMHRITGWDAMTSVLATCPGGLSQIVFFAEDLHADAFIVGVFHAVRMVSIVVFVPLAAQLISG
ncbi:MAG: AbrB family transcriptional regulator [Pyramidobacter sp.]|jgi:membrane AbrB-like protein